MLDADEVDWWLLLEEEASRPVGFHVYLPAVIELVEARWRCREGLFSSGCCGGFLVVVDLEKLGTGNDSTIVVSSKGAGKGKEDLAT